MKQKIKQERRLYVLCDRKLKPVYAAVQGSHAVAQYLIDHKCKKKYWRNEYLIFLKSDINYWKDKLNLLQKDYSCFYEPDLKNKLTAIAVEDDGKLFEEERLLK